MKTSSVLMSEKGAIFGAIGYAQKDLDFALTRVEAASILLSFATRDSGVH
jgi:hypothetical protein